MADTKISGLTALTGAGTASGDLVPIADVSATTTKSITVAELILALQALGIATALGATTTTTLAVTGDMTISDTKNIILNTGTGTKIGTATGQKLGFYNATPVTQASAYTQTYSTADKTHANPTATAMTNANGTGDNTIADVTSSFSQTILNNNFRDCSNAINAIIVDLADLKQLVNSVIDDLQALGLVG